MEEIEVKFEDFSEEAQSELSIGKEEGEDECHIHALQINIFLLAQTTICEDVVAIKYVKLHHTTWRVSGVPKDALNHSK